MDLGRMMDGLGVHSCGSMVDIAVHSRAKSVSVEWIYFCFNINYIFM